MQTKFIVGNWKENPETLEIGKYLLEISENFHSHENTNTHFAVTHAVPSIFAGYLTDKNKQFEIYDLENRIYKNSIK